jgi:hypothetical protein
MPNINFPYPATPGQTYTFNGNVWTYNGYGWTLSANLGATGPQGPTGPTGSAGLSFGEIERLISIGI